MRVSGSIKRWITRRFELFLLRHKNEISRLGKLEIEYSIFLGKLKEQYQSKLYAIPSDYLVVESQPVRIIWWCWLQGEDNAPAICKACLNSLRKYFAEYKIIVVTEQNMYDYVHLPHYILEKYEKGIIDNAHFSDILRTSLLVEYGGVWIDSTVYCTGYNTPFFDYPLFVYQNWKFDIQQSMIASNWLISAKKKILF